MGKLIKVAVTVVLAVSFLGFAFPARTMTDKPLSPVKKVVLTWNSPIDLDLYLTGPAGREGTFRVSPRGLRASNGVWLDANDVPGGGPETITIKDQAPGFYQFYVYNHSDANSTAVVPLSASGASVSVYFGETLRRAFKVPAGLAGNLWTVFSMNGEALITMGNMTSEPNPARIGWKLESALIPGDVLLGAIPDSLVPGKWSHVAIYAGDGEIIEAPSENEDVVVRTKADWDYPGMAWVTYLRVLTADDSVRRRVVEFAREQLGKPYDINFFTKQRNGKSWYCSELVWGAYLNASNGRINLKGSPDILGVYPWEIDHNRNVAPVGGHYEKQPRRSLRVLYLALKTSYTHVTGWVGDLWHWLLS